MMIPFIYTISTLSEKISTNADLILFANQWMKTNSKFPPENQIAFSHSQILWTSITNIKCLNRWGIKLSLNFNCWVCLIGVFGMRNDFLAFISSRLLAILISSSKSHADFSFVPKSLFSKRNSHTCATINNSLKLSIEISKKSIKIITTFVTFCRRDRKRSEPTIKRSKGKFQCCLNQNDPKLKVEYP